MKSNIIFSINKTTVTEGDVVELQWSCAEGATAQLTIDNGYKSATMNVESQGNKQFRLNRSKGKTKLTLTSTVDGKSVSKKIAVRVKKMKVEKAEVIGEDWKSRINRKRSQSKAVNRIPFKDRWNMARSSFKYVWQAMPERKRLAYVILLILSLTMLLSLISPKFISFGIFALVAYLIVVIFKK